MIHAHGWIDERREIFSPHKNLMNFYYLTFNHIYRGQAANNIHDNKYT